MSERGLELSSKQGALRERIAAQRRELVLHAGPLEDALAKADSALSAIEWLKQHPAAVAGVVVVVVVARPKGAWRWTRRVYFVWRGWQTVRNSLLAVL